MSDQFDRRKFLLAGAGALLAACNSQGPETLLPLLRRMQDFNEGLERRLFSPRSRDAVQRGATDAGNKFPTYWISRSMPVWDEAARGRWHLEVTGAVRRPLRLTLEDLARLPRITQRVNHYCVEGWTAVARWSGVRVHELARLAGATADANYVDFESFDSGYHESWDIDSALHRQTIIAIGRDGHFLGAQHGAPARLHSPVKLGYKSVKYLTRIVFSPIRTGGYWSDRGYEWHAGT